MDDDAVYGPETYGDQVAEYYDDWYGPAFSDVGPIVEMLAGLAGRGPALELGIGTGRVALPLSERGVEVHGLDASVEMVARLRAKPGGEAVQVTMGDMADVPVDGSEFTLVYVVFNTFFAMLTQTDQVRCFEQVVRRLARGGRFVIEAFVPDLERFDRGQRVAADHVTPQEVRLEASEHDLAAQRVNATHVVLRADGLRLVPLRIRYAWPSELDLMARIAGLELEDRRGGWRGEEFTSMSGSHVSVYRRP